MTPTPTAISLSLCNQVILDRQTSKSSVIGIFTGLAVDQFPSVAERFSVFASLTDAVGDGTIEIAAIQLASGNQIYSQKGQISFPDRFTVINVNFRVRTISFPSPGSYSILLKLDGESVAERRIRIYQL